MSARALGVRAYLAVAVTAVAVASVGLTGLMVRRGIAEEIAESRTAGAADLTQCVVRSVAEAALVSTGLALLLAVPIALHLARPLRRLNDLASRMARGEPLTAPVDLGGGREIGELGATLGRLAATLQRQEAVRRETSADVVHEIRGALGGVRARLEAVRDGVVDGDVGLPAVAADVRRLGRILDDIPLLVEAQRPGLFVRTRAVDLAAIVRERVVAYAWQFESASIALEHRIRAVTVEGDPERLAQVLDNLLSNALRYTDPGGRVVVSLAPAGRECTVEVADSGIGIPPELIACVFDRFWRAPDARRRGAAGSGIGLAVVRDLVLAHHGRVEVDSEWGSGSRFRVHLPLDLPPQAEAPRGSAPALVPSATGAAATAAPFWSPRESAGLTGV